MWNEVRDIPGEGSGYRLQKVEGPDGEVRYIVYIAGTAGGLFANQSAFNNVHAVGGRLDEAQVKELEKLIPEGAEVMLVGYSQGGMDAQNIAQSGRLNVTQVVTFGSPVRSDLEVPAVHLRAAGDGVPGSAAGVVGPYFDSELAAKKDPSIFRGESPSHRPNGFNGIDVHSNGYGELAKSFDREADNGIGRQKAAVAGLARFQGNVLSEKDIR
ncbi:hypothetical protein BRW64_18950 [Mycolicibacterium diernhoferi]|uniref:PE-PPE domain-containing protein n=2 Tax=Mycolicibacterium diernhoferi TaxID=1801 RepID=A0A1Q4H9E1_9MYCO|nr:hypothetical protein BRW64_18950 [Mycolicibacterium diernhoferi]OPE56094.1 hypothetical protein BV510_01580 [Mycolicibacterium diernhoferi]